MDYKDIGMFGDPGNISVSTGEGGTMKSLMDVLGIAAIFAISLAILLIVIQMTEKRQRSVDLH